MGKISSTIELNDKFSKPIQDMSNAVNMLISHMYDMSNATVDIDVDTSSLDAAKESINAAEAALKQLSGQQVNVDVNENIPTSPQTPEPIQPTWTSNNFDVFSTTGAERYQQEVQSLNSYMQELYSTQQQITQQAQNTDLFPDDMVADLNTLQGRIEAIRAKIQQIEDNPLNVGSDSANAQLEQLRSQLHSMIDDQNNLNEAVENMDVSTANDSYKRLSQTINNTEAYIRDNVNEQGEFTDAVNETNNAANSLNSTIKKAVTALGGVAAIRSTIQWVQGSLDAFDIQNNVETQLQSVLKTVGAADDAFERLKDTASSIQLSGIYGDEAMLGGAAEFATYMSDTDAIESMMNTLADYAMGMSGGGEIDSKAMVDYATNLGKIMVGSYDAMTKKGFEFTEAQEKILDGTATQAERMQELDMTAQELANTSEDMQKALVVDAVIAESWDGLYEAMSNTPEGQIIQMKNAWGDVREEVGQRLYPAILNLLQTINSRMPQIKSVVMGFASAINVVLSIITQLVNAVMWVASIVVDNWSVIAPIVYGIATAVGLYTAALLVNNAVQTISNAIKGVAAFQAKAHAAALMMEQGATFAATAAQYGLNAALYACPLTWIIVLIIAIIALFYVVIAVINNICGTSISATGIIMGLLATIGAYLFNCVAYWWNIISAFIEFFVNVWKNPEYAFKAFIVNIVNAFLNFCLAIVQGNGAAIGVIVGAWYAFCQIIHNIIAAVYNFFAAGIEAIVNGWNQCVYAVQCVLYNIADAAFDVAQGAANCFDAAASSIANAFIGAANTAISAINSIINVLNKIPGVNIGTVSKLNTVSYSGASDAVSAARSNLARPTAPTTFSLDRMDIGSISDAYNAGNQAGQDFASGFESTVADIQAGMQDWLGETPDNYWEAPKLDYINLGDAAKAGYNFGSGIEDKLSNFGLDDMGGIEDIQNTLNDIAGNTGDGAKGANDAADSAGKAAESLDCTDEELKYLRDIAERDAINRFTTAELKVEFHNENNINSDLDIDGVVDALTEKVSEQLEIVAEGVYT